MLQQLYFAQNLLQPLMIIADRDALAGIVTK
jgi:hypothetical protein